MSEDSDLSSSLAKLDLVPSSTSKLITLLHTHLSTAQYFPTWLQNEPTPTCAQYSTIFSTFTASLSDVDVQRDAADTTELKHNALTLLVKSGILPFLAMELGQPLKNVEQLLSDFEERIDRYFCRVFFIPRVYEEGFAYILRTLRLHWALKGSDPTLESLQEYSDQIGEESGWNFQSLSAPQRAAVLFVKASFFGEVQRSGSGYDKQIGITQEVIRLDPSYYQWHLNLGCVLKYKRRASGVNEKPPSSQEIAEILMASDLAPDNPTVSVAKCSCLAELIRSSWGRRRVTFGSEHEFQNADEALEWLRQECKTALTLDPVSVYVNITVAEIFSSILPKWCRDPEFGKECIQRALKYHPNSSKANTRMGIHFLTEERDNLSAQKYFEAAVAGDGRNFPALIQLLQTYLADPEVNREHIERIFEKLSTPKPLETEVKPELDSPMDLNNEKKASLLFQKGIYHFMQKDYVAALHSWMDAYEEFQDVVGFEKLTYYKRRFGWRQPELEHTSIIAQLTPLVDGLGAGEKLGKEVIRLALHARDRGSSDRGRGRGGYVRRGGSEFRGRGGRRGDFRGASDSDNWRH